MARPRHRDRPGGGLEDAAAPLRPRPGIRDAVSPRSTCCGTPRRSSRGADLRRRRDRRPAVRDDAADRRRGPADAVGRRTVGRRARGARHRADRLGAAQRASGRAGAPRRQTVQYSVGAERLRLPHRLRHRPFHRRLRADVGQHHHRHVGLHGTGTVQYQGDSAQLRHLRVGVRALPMPHRRTTLPRRHPRAGRGQPHGHAAAQTVRRPRHHPDRDG